MKKILTLALAAMVACASFAQSPKATVKADKASTAVVKKTLAKGAKAMTIEKAQAKQAAMAAKANAASMVQAPAGSKFQRATKSASSNTSTPRLAEALVTLPETAVVYDWYMSGTDYFAGTAVSNRDVKIGVDGNDIYVGGMFTNFPEAYIKGSLEGTTITFPMGQYLGVAFDTYEFALYGTSDNELVDLTAEYNEAAGSITFNEWVDAGEVNNGFSCAELYTDVKLTAEPKSLTGDPINSLPFVADFADQAMFTEFGVIDANGDGSTWQWNSSYGKALYSYNSYNDADDYLVSPAIYLEAGKNYAVTVNAYSFSEYYPERMEVVMGTATTPEALSTVVIPATDLPTTEDDYVGEFMVAETGYYHFAVHAISDADMFYLMLNSFQVGAGSDPKSPDAVQDLRVVPGPTGQKRATLYFTTPEYTIDGSPLAEELDVNIYRNDELCQTIKSFPGVKKTIFDNTIETSGYVKYMIRANYNDLQGKKAVADPVYVGYDVPETPTNFTVLPAGDHIIFGWDKVGEVGANGGYVDPSLVSYQIWDVVDLIPGWGFYALNSQLSEDLLDVDSYDLPYDCNAGAQGVYIFAVLPVNEAGEGSAPMTSAYLGAPDAIPAHESFEGGQLHYNWFIEGDVDNVSASLVEEGSIDDYAIELNVAEDDMYAGLITNKFVMTGAENATVTADMYSTGEGTTVTLLAELADGVAELETVTLTDEWATYKWDVSAFASDPSVRFHFYAHFDESSSLMFDNFNVIDLYTDNLVATISAPAKVVAGNSYGVTVNVQNLGENTAEGFVVKVYADDQLLDAIEVVSMPLAFYESTPVFAYGSTSIFDEAKDVVLKAVVEYAPELKADDNTDETIMSIVLPTAGKVENLTATTTAEGVVLDWTVPEASFSETTDDFESYDEFAYVQNGENLGDWTGWDLDGGTMYGWNGGNWPHMGETGAFGIYNPTAIGFDTSTIVIPSGEQTALIMAVEPGSGATPGNDDWMVSPELPGVAQTISFMVSELTDQYGDEQFEVLVSTTGKTPECFTKIADGQASTEWVEFTAELPEGAKYFAIRCISQDVFGLLIDDATFTVGAGNPTSFNVYVDQVKVGSTEDKTYTVTGLAAGEHSLAVTAVYGVNESAPETVTVVADGDATAIKNIEAANAKEIYTVGGVRVSEAKNAGVYVVNGQKVIIK